MGCERKNQTEQAGSLYDSRGVWGFMQATRGRDGLMRLTLSAPVHGLGWLSVFSGRHC